MERENARKSPDACAVCGKPGGLHKPPNGNYEKYWPFCLTPLCESCWQKARKKLEESEEIR